MSVRREIAEYDGLYFITFTCCRWLKLFEITNMHSSAKYYATGEQGIYEVMSYALLAYIDLTKALRKV
jgi:hypothetical protein